MKTLIRYFTERGFELEYISEKCQWFRIKTGNKALSRTITVDKIGKEYTIIIVEWVDNHMGSFNKFKSTRARDIIAYSEKKVK